MPVICRDFDVLYNDVPGTGGRFTARVLTGALRGEEFEPKHLSFRRTPIVDPPSIRIVTVRDPVDWYRWYWARARASVVHPGSWPLSLGHDEHYPTRPLDERCGHGDFPQFIRNVLREFPDGFLRSVYCDFLNGATDVLRYASLADDLDALLERRGLDPRPMAADVPPLRRPTNKWWRSAVLPSRLERELREAENLDGLAIPYVRRQRPATRRRPSIRRNLRDPIAGARRWRRVGTDWVVRRVESRNGDPL